MKKKYNLKDVNLCDIDEEDLSKLLDPWTFKVLLQLEPDSYESEIMMWNMLEYFEMTEEYDYCIVLRDVINSRKEKSQS